MPAETPDNSEFETMVSLIAEQLGVTHGERSDWPDVVRLCFRELAANVLREPESPSMRAEDDRVRTAIGKLRPHTRNPTLWFLSLGGDRAKEERRRQVLELIDAALAIVEPA